MIDAGAVLGDLREREADVGQPRHLAEEGVVAAGRVGAALQDVPGDDGAGEAVPVVARPAVVPRRGPADERGVGGAPGYDDVGAAVQGRRDAPAAEVGVGRHGWPRRGGVSSPTRSRTSSPDTAATDGLQAEPLGQGADGIGAPARVEPARVDDDLDALLEREAEAVLELAEEGRREALGRVLRAGAEQQQHRQLGEVVAGEDVQRPLVPAGTVEHLPHGGHAVAVEAGAVADAERGRHDGRR